MEFSEENASKFPINLALLNVSKANQAETNKIEEKE